MRIHVLGVPHTQTTKAFTTCAFTQKVFKLCQMMHGRGHAVVHYGVEGSDPPCTENVAVVTKAEWERVYPHPGKEFYAHDKPTPEREVYLALWAARTRKALAQRVGDPYREILALTWGGAQRDAIKATPDQYEVEAGIGYPISWAPYRVYESYAWLHMHLGRDNGWGGGCWYWCVIPNAFDLADFEYREKKGEDFLFLGRLNWDKGTKMACDIAKAVGRRITIVGQGDPTPYLAPHVTYLPPVGPAERKELLANAYAVLCPSWYVEPFCGVHIEAQLSGTPVITTDWGVFPEGMIHGVTGWRCRTLEQFVWAAQHVDYLDPSHCQAWAASNFSLERIALMYEEFFQQVLNLRLYLSEKARMKAGWNLFNANRTQLDWLYKDYDFGPVAHTGDAHSASPLDLTRAHEAPPGGGPRFTEPGTVADDEPAAQLASSTDVTEAEWVEAQAWERRWWGTTPSKNWEDEQRKQETYARLMCFPDRWDFGVKTILDVGCGPVSLLRRSIHGPSRGVDPLTMSEETRGSYVASNIEILNVKAEDMPEDKAFDEVWMYNVLQHTHDPHAILRKIAKLGDAVRIFEWIDIKEKWPGHPQLLTEELFRQYFGGVDWDRRMWNVGTLTGECDGRYLALWAVKVAAPAVASVCELPPIHASDAQVEAVKRALVAAQ